MIRYRRNIQTFDFCSVLWTLAQLGLRGRRNTPIQADGPSTHWHNVVAEHSAANIPNIHGDIMDVKKSTLDGFRGK